MDPTAKWLVYCLVFCTGFFVLQTCLGTGRQAAKKLRAANTRLRAMQKEDAQADILSKMRKTRGLSKDGTEVQNFIRRLGEMVVQSGLPLGAHGIYIFIAVSAACLAGLGLIWKSSLLWAMIGLQAGLLLPFLVLKFLIKRRRNKAVNQLPEALDIIIRSLAAGHPVPVAMGLVAREMPDPIGSEFGIASDEVAYGATVGAAIQRLSDRVGHEDFELFSAMIRLQERTGGNLAELLRSNAKTIRDRQKMRMKVKACSAEGKVSALILNAAPIALLILINLLNPEFYGDVMHLPIIKYTMYGVIAWMVLGNLIMRKMINFKI